MDAQDQFIDLQSIALSIALDITPGIGSVKALIEAVIGQDLITKEKISTTQRLLLLGLIALPHLRTAGRALKSGMASGFTLLKDGKLSWKTAQAGFVAINLKSFKSPPKIPQSTGREIVLDKVKTFQQARNMALEILRDLVLMLKSLGGSREFAKEK